MSVIRLSGVSYHRNGNRILSGIDWEIQQGQHWAILGANGSGKTTLLKIITGYDWVTEGRVEVLGRRLGECDVRSLRKSIGWVSSSLEHRLPTADTALDVVVSGIEAWLGVWRPFDAGELERAKSALALVGAGSLERKRYGVLSQGEQQRVLIARALVAEPVLLILDEPCAGLDPAARARFLADIQRLAATRNAPTLVLVTHHVEEIGPWVNRVLVLKEGRALAKGAPQEVLTGTVLSEAFSAQCQIRSDGDGYRLRIGL